MRHQDSHGPVAEKQPPLDRNLIYEPLEIEESQNDSSVKRSGAAPFRRIQT
jgi:hypothetical protein